MESSARQKIHRALDPNAELKHALATMNFDSVVSKELANYLADSKHGILSNEFAKYLAKRFAGDEKKPKGSRDEGEKDDCPD
jgi:hypothetical protein